MAISLRSAVSLINKRGMLLVFPINNRKEPSSLWREFHPRSPMVWEWDEDGDSRVSDLWHLRERLATSRQVVYCKWFRGRATVMSLDLFRALARLLGSREGLSFQSREILDLLDEDSPQSTKGLKRAAGLQGRELEKVYQAAMKELWSRLLIVASGEVDEGAFPSLAIGSSQVIFEDVWREAQDLEPREAERVIERFLPEGGPFRKYVDEVIARCARH